MEGVACRQQRSLVIARASLEKPLVALAFVLFFIPPLTTANTQTAETFTGTGQTKIA